MFAWSYSRVSGAAFFEKLAHFLAFLVKVGVVTTDAPQSKKLRGWNDIFYVLWMRGRMYSKQLWESIGLSCTLVDKPLSLTESLMSRKANVFSKISQVYFRAGWKEFSEVINFQYFPKFSVLSISLARTKSSHHFDDPWFKGYPFVYL